MSVLTVLADEMRTAPGRFDGDRALVAVGDLSDALGWELKPEGLCRGDVCVPVADRSAIGTDDELDLAAVASTLGRLVAADAASSTIALAADPELRRRALRDLRAPDFTLPAIDGGDRALSDWRGRKRLLVTFASW